MRRRLLTLALLAVLAVSLPSCASSPGRSSAPRSFTFVQICDTQLGMGGYEHDVQAFEQAVRQINSIGPDFVVICGDLVGRPQKHSFTDFNAIRAKFEMPCYCVPGNHDVGNTPTPETLARYRKDVGEDYYAFVHKGYSFICVNTQLWKAPLEGESERHDAWVSDELAAASRDGRPVFIIAHHPLFTKQPEEGDGYYNLPPAKRAELLALFEKHGVVAVLSGHAHKIIINDYRGIQMVSGQATSRTHGGALGFRLWHVAEPGPYRHESVDLEPFGRDDAAGE